MSRANVHVDEHPGDRGSVTVEFAVVLPVLVIVAGLAIGVTAAAGAQMRLQVGASAIARALGRGDAAAADAATALVLGARTTTERAGGTVCVTASRPVALRMMLPTLTVTARGCALEGGR